MKFVFQCNKSNNNCLYRTTIVKKQPVVPSQWKREFISSYGRENK